MTEIDILEELLKEQYLVPEGEYVGTIESIAEIKTTQSAKTAYTTVRVKIASKKHIYIFLPGAYQTLKLIVSFQRAFIGKKVKVIVKHRKHGDQLYLDGHFKDVA